MSTVMVPSAMKKVRMPVTITGPEMVSPLSSGIADYQQRGGAIGRNGEQEGKARGFRCG